MFSIFIDTHASGSMKVATDASGMPCKRWHEGGNLMASRWH